MRTKFLKIAGAACAAMVTLTANPALARHHHWHHHHHHRHHRKIKVVHPMPVSVGGCADHCKG
jgi:hypothetical protein